MALPGYVVDIVEAPPNISQFSDTGLGFWIGAATTPGPAAEIYSIDQFTGYFGARLPESNLYDAVETFFREGGVRLIVACADAEAESADLVALLPQFTADYGCGQVAAPGVTDTATQLAILEHCASFNGLRVSVLDGMDTAAVATLTAQANALTNQPGCRFSSLWAPWDIIPGLTYGTTRTVPPSARMCGMMARNDAAGYNPNVAAAGIMGQSQYTTDLSQYWPVDSDRQTLNENGVNVTKLVYGAPRAYGWRSLASQTTDEHWSTFADSRTVMAIYTRLSVVAENFVFSELDGQGLMIAKFAGQITGELTNFWKAGALFGATAAQAFSVDIGPAVNTLATLARGELHAKCGLIVSRFAEVVYIDVAKVPLGQQLPQPYAPTTYISPAA